MLAGHIGRFQIETQMQYFTHDFSPLNDCAQVGGLAGGWPAQKIKIH
jgi:hypothetical protein